MLEASLLSDRIGPARGLRIVDVGCGKRALAIRLEQGGVRVIGIDASAEGIAAARSRAKAAGAEVDLVEGDVGYLPFVAEHSDRTLLDATPCFVDDRRQAIRQMVCARQPRGRLILGELGHWNLWAAQRRVNG